MRNFAHHHHYIIIGLLFRNWWFLCKSLLEGYTLNRQNMNLEIKRSSIFSVNQKFELEPRQAMSLEIVTQIGQEFSLKDYQFIVL